MKKIIVLITVLLASLAAYVVAGPFITANNIQTALEEQDSKKLGNNVDFPVLRENLKQQLMAQVEAKTAQLPKNNPLAMLAGGFSAQLVNGIVDNLVTPAGMAHLLSARSAAKANSGEVKPRDPASLPRYLRERAEQAAQRQKEMQQASSDTQSNSSVNVVSGNGQVDVVKKQSQFDNGEYHYDSHQQFSVVMSNPNGQKIHFILHRDGIHWYLSNIILPKLL